MMKFVIEVDEENVEMLKALAEERGITVQRVVEILSNTSWKMGHLLLDEIKES